MKQLRISVIALGAAMLLALGSCQKDTDGSTFTATLERYADYHTKTFLDGNRLKWDAGDQIIVLNDHMYFGIYQATSGGDTYTSFTYSPDASGTGMDIDVGDPQASCYEGDNSFSEFFQAIYPADIVDLQQGGVVLSAAQQSSDGNLHGFPMYAYSTNNNLSFKNAFGLIKLTIQKANTSITSISITADRIINGLFTIDNNAEFTLGDGTVPPLVYANDGSGSHTTTLSLGTGSGIDVSTAHDFYICLPPTPSDNPYSNLTITLTNSEGAFCTLTTNSDVTIPVARSCYTAFNLIDNNPADPLLVFTDISGLFSVGPNQYVQFAPGNLQYSPSTNVYRFAPSQLDFVGESQGAYFRGEISSIEWIDLFGWGTGNNPTFSSTDDADYSTFTDWGNNTISNGGGYTWRTLTKDEWLYLASGRANAFQKFGGANIDGVDCFIFLPDAWNQPAGTTFVPGFGWNDFYTRNTYSAAQGQLMQAAGALILPAAGAMGVISFQNTVDWMYTHSSDWPILGTNWDEAEGLASVLWLLVQMIDNANAYWSSSNSGTTYLSNENENTTNGAYCGAFSPTGFLRDIFQDEDIDGIISDGEEAGFYLANGLYAAMLPISPQAKCAVRLVRTVTPGASK